MAFKTILVHLTNDEAHMMRLRLALEIAARHDAHLVALYIATPISMPAEITGRGASVAYIAEATDIAREKAGAVREEILAECKRRSLSWEWQMEEGDHLDILAKYAHYADLAIVSHSRSELIENRVMFHVPEDLPLTVGCPVLILPESGDFVAPRRNILVAWKASRECLHTVRASLPMLKRADNVIVLCVSGSEETPPPSERAAAFIARHGVKAEAFTDIDGGDDVGDVILAQAKDLRADLIVMGGYGRSRLREMVLGGVTRDVLNNTPLPVLMGH